MLTPADATCLRLHDVSCANDARSLLYRQIQGLTLRSSRSTIRKISKRMPASAVNAGRFADFRGDDVHEILREPRGVDFDVENATPVASAASSHRATEAERNRD
jgi:hypothetical protein